MNARNKVVACLLVSFLVRVQPYERISEVLERSGIRCMRLDAIWSPWSLRLLKNLSKSSLFMPAIRLDTVGLISSCNTKVLISESPLEGLKKLKPQPLSVRFLTLFTFQHLPSNITQLNALLTDPLWRKRRSVLLPLNKDHVYVKSEFDHNFTAISIDNYTLPKPEKITGQEISVSTFNCTIYSHFIVDPLTQKGYSADGVEMRLFEVMASHLNLKIKIVSSSGHGILEPNSTYTWGSVKYLVTGGQADVGFCELWVTPDLYHRVDMLRPWHRSGIRYLVPRPQQKRYLYAGLESIPSIFWFYLVITMAACTPLLRILATRPPFISVDLGQGVRSGWWYWPNQLVSLVLTGMPAGGGGWMRTMVPLRLVVTGWSFFSLLVVTVYSCKLVSHLNNPSWEQPLQNEQDMLRAGWIWSRHNIIMTTLKYIYPEETSWLAAWISRHKFDADMPERVRRMRSKKYAVYGQAIGNIYYLPEDSKPPADVLSTYQAADHNVINYSITIMMSKWSGFTPAIRRLFSHLSDAGIVYKIFSDVLISPTMNRYIVRDAFDRCLSCFKEEVSEGLGLDVMVGPFILVGLGYILSTLVFILEILCCRLLRPTLQYTE